MTPKQIEKLQKKVDDYHTLLLKLCGAKIKLKINELIELELQLEAECNK